MGWASDQSAGVARASVSRACICRPGSRDPQRPRGGASWQRFSWDSVPAQHTNLNSPEIAVSIFVLQFPRGASASLGDEGGQHSAACVGFSGLGAWTNDAKGIGTMNSLGIICT